VLRLFNLPERDYKRFQAFLFQHKCNLPFRSYRSGELLTASLDQKPRYESASRAFANTEPGGVASWRSETAPES